MNFVLFLLLNAVLLLRPEELFPEIAGLRLYLLTIVPCTLLSLPELGRVLSFESLRRLPVAVCVLLFFVATIVSTLLNSGIGEALFDFGLEFAKVILYYFLLLAVVDSRERFRVFVGTLVVLIGGLTAIALAEYHGVADFPNITPCMQREYDAVTGEESILPRLVSSGIFNDPNDLCLVLGLGILSCVYLATTGIRGIAASAFWLLPIPLFIYALLDTHSKGGLLGILAGGAGYLYSRYGGAKGLPYAVGGCVAVLAVIGGRQGSIGGGGTSHERLMFWADGLSNLFSQPFSIPTGLGPDWFVNENGLVAHNSFVQAYVEFGVIGGGAFLGAFYIAARILDRFGRGVVVPPWVLQARHYGFAVLVGYAMGCFSLTRNFTITTYMTLGIVTVLVKQAAPTQAVVYQVNALWFRWAALVSICGLLALKFVTQSLCATGV
jgi:putative inorganic carbon (hco3(-)) transporter